MNFGLMDKFKTKIIKGKNIKLTIWFQEYYGIEKKILIILIMILILKTI